MTTAQSLTYALPSPQELSAGAESALELVEAFEVVDDATYQLAGEELNSCLRVLSRLNERRLVITRPMDEAKGRVMDLFRAPVASLERDDEQGEGCEEKDDDHVVNPAIAAIRPPVADLALFVCFLPFWSDGSGRRCPARISRRGLRARGPR